MKVLGIFGAFIFAFLWATAASAAIYSWTDENGVLHFTNVAPPPQARLVLKDIPREDNGTADRPDDEPMDARLKRAEERADDLEQNLDEARDEAQEALQRARALEERLAEANRLAAEAQSVQQTSYRYEETVEEEYSGYPYYGGYVYRAVPYVGKRDRWKHPRKSHLKKARHKTPRKGYKPAGDIKSIKSHGVRINRAQTQSIRTFNRSRSNPLQSNFVSRRAIFK